MFDLNLSDVSATNIPKTYKLCYFKTMDYETTLATIPAGQRNLFQIFAARMNTNNIIDLNITIKKEIAEIAKVTVGTLNVNLSNLCKIEYLLRVAPNRYMLNPNFVSKSSKNEELIKDWEMLISKDN
jgi:RecG-like helicase